MNNKPATANATWSSIDEVAWVFEQRWRSVEAPPAIDEFVSAACCTALIETLVGIDVEYSWKAGRRRQVESYLHLFAENALEDDRVWQLVRFELDACHAAGQAVNWELLARRFPQFADKIAGCKNSGEFSVNQSHGECESGLLIRQYQLREKIGQGTFAEVWRAYDHRLRRDVAVKVLHRTHALSSESYLLMKREARAIARLEHPSIVSVYDYGVYGHRPFIVSKFVKGETFADRLSRLSELDETDAVKILVQIAEALVEIHQAGIVHRDVKPANILIDGANVACLTDFGLCTAASPQQDSDAWDLVGTPAYMSPEQARGDVQAIDHRSDVYSFGCVLYHALTGQLPFLGRRSSLRPQVAEANPRATRGIDDATSDLQRICCRCLQTDPENRYQSAGALRDDLRRFLDDHGPSVAVRSRLQVNRRFRLNCLAGALVAAIVFIVVTEFSVISRLSSQRRQSRLYASRGAVAGVKRDRQTLGRVSFEAGSMALKKGEFPLAIEHFERAIDFDFAKPHLARFGICRAKLESDGVADAASMLRALTKSERQDVPRGELLIMMADLANRGEPGFGEPLTLYSSALQCTLSPAQRHYAMAMCAESLPESVSYLEESLRADPIQLGAARTLVLLLITMSRFDEAETLASSAQVRFPEDRELERFRLVAACAAGAAPDISASSRFEAVDQEQFQRMQSTLQAMDTQRRGRQEPSVDRLVFNMKAILYDVSPFLRGRAAYPPKMKRAFKDLLVAHRNNNRDHATQLNLVEAIQKVHPDPWLHDLLVKLQGAQLSSLR